MKHLIYLDQQRTRSFYSQAFDGLEESSTKGESHSRSDTTNLEPSITIATKRGSMGVDSSYLAGETSVTRGRKVQNFSDSESTSDSLTQLLHDNAVDRIIAYAKNEKLLCDAESGFQVGKYAIVSGEYQLVDWDYYLGLMSNNFLKFTADHVRDSAPIPPKANEATVKHIRQTAENTYRAGINNTREILQVIKEIVPLETFLLIENCAIPMRGDSFLEGSGSVIFMYDQPITVFGRVTKINADLVNARRKGAMGVLNAALNDVIASMIADQFGIKHNECVFISPMAAFFE